MSQSLHFGKQPLTTKEMDFILENSFRLQWKWTSFWKTALDYHGNGLCLVGLICFFLFN